MKDFYYILGTDTKCTFDEIERAYNKLSKKLYPDVDQIDDYFEKHFREIQEAYYILSDPERRSTYDSALNKFKTSAQRKGYKRPAQAKFIDIGFTVVLITVTVIFANYVQKSLSGSQTNKVIKQPVAELIKPVAAASVSPITQIAKVHIIKQHFPISIVKTKPVLENKTGKKIIADSVKITSIKAAPVIARDTMNKTHFLYTTLVNSNATGVINMRMSADYSSNIVKIVPNHSMVSVLERGDAYYKVLFDKSMGYIPKWTLKIK